MRPDRETFTLCLVLALLCFALTGLLQGCAVLSRPEWPAAPAIVALDSLEREAFPPAYVVISGKPKGPVIIQTGAGAGVQAKASQSGGLTPYLVGAGVVVVLSLLGWLAFRRR